MSVNHPGDESDWNQVIFVFCFYFGLKAGGGLLGAVFGLSAPMAYCIAALVGSLLAYPAYFCGRPYPWADEDEPWTFRRYLPFSLIGSIVVFFIAALIQI